MKGLHSSDLEQAVAGLDSDGFGPAVAKLNAGSFERVAAGLCKLETQAAVTATKAEITIVDNVTGITSQTHLSTTHSYSSRNAKHNAPRLSREQNYSSLMMAASLPPDPTMVRTTITPTEN